MDPKSEHPCNMLVLPTISSDYFDANGKMATLRRKRDQQE